MEFLFFCGIWVKWFCIISKLFFLFSRDRLLSWSMLSNQHAAMQHLQTQWWVQKLNQLFVLRQGNLYQTFLSLVLPKIVLVTIKIVVLLQCFSWESLPGVLLALRVLCILLTAAMLSCAIRKRRRPGSTLVVMILFIVIGVDSILLLFLCWHESSGRPQSNVFVLVSRWDY